MLRGTTPFVINIKSKVWLKLADGKNLPAQYLNRNSKAAVVAIDLFYLRQSWTQKKHKGVERFVISLPTMTCPGLKSIRLLSSGSHRFSLPRISWSPCSLIISSFRVWDTICHLMGKVSGCKSLHLNEFFKHNRSYIFWNFFNTFLAHPYIWSFLFLFVNPYRAPRPIGSRYNAITSSCAFLFHE